MAGRLAGEVAVVTGGASGIGRAVSLLFQREGARVTVGDLNEDLGRQVVEQMESPRDGAFVPADVSRADDARRLIETAESSFGPATILVNCAGASGRHLGDGPVGDCTEEAWEFVLATNLKSVYLCSKFAIPGLRGAGRGSIINIASVLGLIGSPFFPTHAYAASKGGVLSLTRAMAVNYAADRIRVNAICPGVIDTPMSARALADPAAMTALKTQQPLTGAPGTPEDVASVALFLASSDSGFMTGCVLPVDGGLTAQ